MARPITSASLRAGMTATTSGQARIEAGLGDFGETDALAHAKVKAAWRAGLTAVLCVGETRRV